MLINTVLIDHMAAQNLPLRLLPDREPSTYSWPELMGVHPDAHKTVASLMNASYCSSAEEFDELYMPSLAPVADESDYDYDARLSGYLENSYFPAQTGSTLASSHSVSFVYVCYNPFLSVLDEHTDSPFVIVPQEVINGILRGTRSELSSIAPYSEDEPIEHWLNRIIAAAYSHDAADIELTSHPSSIKVRLKIMGEWGDWVSSIPLIQRGSLLRALCASASPSLDYEPGADHDFKLEKRIQGIDTSWRGAITPAALGDSVTLRLLPGIGRVPTLEELGYNEQACHLIRSTKNRRDGLVLVTGSTGHGKTTTLYSVVTEIRDDGRKVFTVEDPVELVIPGAIQKSVADSTNIDAKYRVTFAGAIRTALRHAPDVLVVGETRDSETATTAVGASRTGHLTFTTLHTTNIRTSIKRMLDLGIDATNLADTLTLVVSQNLVRTLCPHCRIEQANGQASRKHDGCTHCRGRGMIGRTVIYEMAYLDDDAREAIIDNTLASHFPRLQQAGLYISKHDVAQDLLNRGLVDKCDVMEFLHV